jgi:dephospho-CoA kinase
VPNPLVAIALVGMPGAGKSDLAITLSQATRAAVGSLSDPIRRELITRGGGTDPRDYARMAAQLRNAHGEGVLVRRSLEAATSGSTSSVVILDSLRTRAERDEAARTCARLLVVAVHASRERRFARMRARSGPELQATADLLAQDAENLRLGVGNLMALSDVMLVNNHESWQPIEQAAPELLSFLREGAL